MLLKTDDLRIQSISPLITPLALFREIPVSQQASHLIIQTREAAAKIMHGKDKRLLIIVGPCSIHDPQSALEYAKKLKAYADTVKDQLLIIMRVYFEKPRTTVGWKGLINDPGLNQSFDINHGLKLARQLLSDINELGIPVASEFLDTITPQYLSDFIAWGAIGARTTESQIHRELASGLSMPIGFKNGTDGSVQIAIDAIQAAGHAHNFLSVTKEGIAAIVKTLGNKDCHVILRGSHQFANYDEQSIQATVQDLKKAQLPSYIMVDCSHGNSQKDYKKQMDVAKSLAEQIKHGNQAIKGVMIESNLVEGRQDLNNEHELVFGQSITDACLGFDDTIYALNILAKVVTRK